MQSILLIGLFATLLFCFGFLSFVAQSKMQFRTNCLKKSVELQRQIIKSEKVLFALNPLSTALQTRYDSTQAELVTASAANNYPAVIKLEADLIKIRLDQLKLDTLQKSIINSSQIMVTTSLLQLTNNFHLDSQRLNKLWTGFLDIFFVIYFPNKTIIAVRAASSGVAPNYELTSQYKSSQKVAFVWQMKYWTRNETQKLLSSENQFELSCQALPNKNGDQWSIEI